jgi:hypothetical protein
VGCFFLLALDWSVQEGSLWKDLGLVFQVMVWWKLRASLLLLAAGVDVVVTLRFCAPLHLLPASFSAALVIQFYRFINLSAFLGYDSGALSSFVSCGFYQI